MIEFREREMSCWLVLDEKREERGVDERRVCFRGERGSAGLVF